MKSKLISKYSEKEIEVPQGWQRTKLEQLVVDPKSSIVDGPFGSNLKKSEYIEEGVPVIRLQNIEPGKLIKKNLRYITQKKAKQLDRHNFITNDVVITKLGDPLGEATLIPEDMNNGIIVADIVRIRTDNRFVFPKFVMYYINSPKIVNHLKLKTKGTTRPRVNLHHIRNLDILFPPLNEQKKIVSKVEELFSNLDINLILLKKTKKQLHNYTRSLLKNAFEGKLSKDWRKNNLDKVSPVSDLIKKIRDAQSKSDVDFITKLTPLDKSKLFNLPSTWVWLRMGDIANMVSGKAFKKKEYSTQGVRLFQIANVSFGKILWESLAYLPKNYLEKYPHLELKSGDIMLALNRPLLEGRLKIGKLGDDDVPSILYQRVGRFDFYYNKIKDFFYFFLQSLIFINLLSKSLQGVDQPFINKPKLLQLPIPLPPLEEQKIIMEIIKSKLSIIEYTFNLTSPIINKIKSNKQSILKSAFEGKIVPQDPTDEPASVLLEKIKKEKEKLQKNKKAIIKIKTRGKKK